MDTRPLLGRAFSTESWPFVSIRAQSEAGTTLPYLIPFQIAHQGCRARLVREMKVVLGDFGTDSINETGLDIASLGDDLFGTSRQEPEPFESLLSELALKDVARRYAVLD